MIHVNIDAVVAMGLVCIPYMKKGSHLINIASQASFSHFRTRISIVQQSPLSEIILER